MGQMEFQSLLELETLFTAGTPKQWNPVGFTVRPRGFYVLEYEHFSIRHVQPPFGPSLINYMFITYGT